MFNPFDVLKQLAIAIKSIFFFGCKQGWSEGDRISPASPPERLNNLPVNRRKIAYDRNYLPF